MMKQHAGKFAAFIVCLFSFIAVLGYAEDAEVSRATLAGIQAVSVVVEEAQPNIRQYAEKFGLSGMQIHRDVTQRLHDHGIRVVEGKEWLKVPGQPVLYVNVNTHETEKYWYAYDIRVELRQVVIPDANPKVKILASTWSLNITGLTNIGNLNIIRQDMETLLGRFVQAYKVVNGKR
jgi:hypothetical protein